ncbi:MAG: hypothetical protein AAFU78_14880 [Cyanobacteria bacterium J06633_2]
MEMDQSFTEKDRIESLKAGVIGAIALGLAFAGLSLLHVLWRHTPLATLGFIPIYGIGLEGLISGAIALVSGFLFGVTYRYIVRTDDNPHLKAGAVGAFGLVRGLSQVDIGLLLHGNRWLLLLLVGESMAMMAIAQVVMDWSFRQQWIQPFGQTVADTPEAGTGTHDASDTIAY